ncbi:MAG: hypothetical protein QOD97_2736 [Mycobacterium sp.]|nr:hypothetical protein [Mycobacterium sp.]
MWPWVIGSLSLAAAVNQIAIALCRRAQAATGRDHHELVNPQGGVALYRIGPPISVVGE